MRALPFVYAGTALLASAVGLALWTGHTQADSDDHPNVPRFQVDSTWPKPFPTTPDPVTGRARTWIPGEVAGTCIDSHDHVFIVTRGNLISPEDVKGIAAPPVMEFDTDGNVVNAWGDRNVLPNGIHGCFVDYQDNVWIAGNGDGIVQKYTHNGACCCCRSGRAAYATTRRRMCAATRAPTRSPTRARRCSTSLPTCTSIRTGIR